MTDQDYAAALDEIERLLNDPLVYLEPGRVWTLLDAVAAKSRGVVPGSAQGRHLA